ncbi:MAG: hypothetical protein QME74_08075, partial [Candidatus Edwardsbacteria bacterium]|nr:hypothetical protein [Candidatus Edwardsbacteria bacterium]
MVSPRSIQSEQIQDQGQNGRYGKFPLLFRPQSLIKSQLGCHVQKELRSRPPWAASAVSGFSIQSVSLFTFLPLSQAVRDRQR